MSNPCLRNLQKIEFVVTDACTGRCKHCSQGEHRARGARIDPAVAAQAVQKIAAVYPIRTVMTFGGEPLLHREAVFAILGAASELGIPKRQLITNGYFSKSDATVRDTARRLAACGVNDLLLSVDAFHQETIPLEAVRGFAVAAKACGIPLRLSPAWLVHPEDDNPYDRQTRSLLAAFSDLAIPVGEGNTVFPEGNALRYLAAYVTQTHAQNPYEEDPYDVRCVSFSPNGDVLNGNVYTQDIIKILKEYAP